MEFLTRLLFESFFLLLIASLVAMAIALAIHRRRYSKASRRGIWITLGVCILLFILQGVVMTDREALRDKVQTMARAVDEGDLATLGEQIDSAFITDAAFGGRERDKQEFMAYVNSVLQRYQVDQARVRSFQIEVNGDRANVSFSVLCEVRRAGQLQSYVNSSWELEFIRRDDGWKLYRMIKAEAGPGGMNIPGYLGN